MCCGKFKFFTLDTFDIAFSFRLTCQHLPKALHIDRHTHGNHSTCTAITRQLTYTRDGAKRLHKPKQHQQQHGEERHKHPRKKMRTSSRRLLSEPPSSTRGRRFLSCSTKALTLLSNHSDRTSPPPLLSNVNASIPRRDKTAARQRRERGEVGATQMTALNKKTLNFRVGW